MMQITPKKRILGIIPARGGSKGIKDKNIVDINGKPLIAYTIEAANKALTKGILARVIVSTDSDAIRDIALKFQAEVPFLRPVDLSGDKAKSFSFVNHALHFLWEQQSQKYDAVMILQPTSPLRTAEDIGIAADLFDNNNAESLISCYYDSALSENILYHKQGDMAVAISSHHGSGSRRQENPQLYVRNGAIYLCSVEYLKCSNTLISDEPLMYEMPKSRSINIDAPDDLERLRKLICNS